VVTSLRKEIGARLTDWRAWVAAMFYAGPIIALVLYLTYTWFGVRDRYEIFLYFHDMGPGFDTTPFGRVTASRYWMSGLVAGGVVMVLYTLAHLVLGRAIRGFRPPEPWRVWVLCADVALIATPAIAMTVNDPTLPLLNAAQVGVATLAGLGLAVALGQFAAAQPGPYLALMVDGLPLALLMIAGSGFGSYPRWLAAGNTTMIVTHLAVVAAGIVALAVTTGAYFVWPRLRVPDAGKWLLAGAQVAYLLLPLNHHLFFCKDDGTWLDPDYFSYIPDADNYFAHRALVQVGIWAAVGLIALGVTRLRRRLIGRRKGP